MKVVKQLDVTNREKLGCGIVLYGNRNVHGRETLKPCRLWMFQHYTVWQQECKHCNIAALYRGADKFLARPTSRYILFDVENISFDASLVIYVNSTKIPPIVIINRIYEHQNLLSLQLVSFLVGLRTYQHPCNSRPHCATDTLPSS